MKLLKDRNEVLTELQRAGRNGLPLLCPNAETPDEMEGVLLGAQRHALRHGLARCAVGIGFTASYPDHSQLGGIALGGTALELREAAQKWLYWLNGYAGSRAFERVAVIPFLDHGWVPNAGDRALMDEEWFVEALGIVMHDASALDFEENVALTADYVRRVGKRVVVEACPDKVYEHAQIVAKGLRAQDLWSKPVSVEDFVKRTGVDLIVPNLGTEHRAASGEALEFQRELSRELKRRVGPILALHGTSSLGGKIGTVGPDGICKINYYTGMARGASKALAATWAEPGAEAWPVGVSCGSHVFRTRREAVALDVAVQLHCLVSGRMARAGTADEGV